MEVGFFLADAPYAAILFAGVATMKVSVTLPMLMLFGLGF